jgi:hypothetical protein
MQFFQSPIHPFSVHIFSWAPCNQLPSVYVLPLMSETKFHTHTKPQAKLKFCIHNFFFQIADEKTKCSEFFFCKLGSHILEVEENHGKKQDFRSPGRDLNPRAQNTKQKCYPLDAVACFLDSIAWFALVAHLLLGQLHLHLFGEFQFFVLFGRLLPVEGVLTWIPSS